MPYEQLSIRLLGDFALTTAQADSVDNCGVNTARLQALLAYLLLHRAAPQQRQHLAFLFWPDTGEAQALTNLRNLLHKLRQVLPTPARFLVINPHAVQWRPDAPYRLDVADFEAAVAHAATRATLETAISYYQGDLLPSCYDDWILPERERLRQLALAALDRLLTLLEAQRDYGAAIRYGQQLLQLEPFNEALYRRLMGLSAANDDRTSALHLYQRCVAMLQAEFAAEPAPATQELYQRLHTGLITPPPSRRVPEQPLLVGRSTEWQALVDGWYRASSGIPQCLLLTGEAGIGKTRLAEELLAWVARQGHGAVAAHCYAAEGALAYAPIVAWLRTDFIYQRLGMLEPMWLTEVARLLPELLTLHPQLPVPGPLTAGWQRQRLFEALARALLTSQGPLLLLLDDLQWADRDTLAWLHFLLRFSQSSKSPNAGATQPHGRILLLGTVRSEERGNHQPLQDLLLALQRDAQLTELALGPLDAQETATLATAVAGQALTLAQTTDLYAETEGNPLFIVETVRAKENNWAAPTVTPYFPLTGTEVVQHTLPPKVQAVIQARLVALSPPTRELVGLAATIGRAFPFQVLAKASKQDDEQLVNSLDELCQHQIVRERGADTYDFTHDKLREATYNSLSAARRHLLHKRVAAALVAVYTEHPGTHSPLTLDAVSGQIATHYELAGDFAQAIAYYQQAAEAAHRLSANQEAVRAYRRAIALVEGPAGQAHPQALSLYTRLGEILHGLSQYDEARALFTQALNHTTTMDAVQCAALHRQIGNTWREQYDYPNALQHYCAAASVLETPGRVAPHRTTRAQLPAAHPLVEHVAAVNKDEPAWWEAWIQTQLEIDLVYYWLGESAASAALQSALQPLVEQHATPGQQATFFQRRGQLELRCHRSMATAAAVVYMRRSFTIYQEAAMQDSLPAAHFMLGFTLLWHDDLEAAAAELQITLRLAEQQGDLSLQARALTYLTIATRRRDLVAATQPLATQAFAVATQAHMPEYIALAYANQAWLAWRQQAYGDVREQGQAALALWQQLPVTHASAPFQWTARWPLLATALHGGALAVAIEHARALLDPHQQQLPESLATILTQASQCWTADDTVQTQSWLTQAVAQAQQLHYL